MFGLPGRVVEATASDRDVGLRHVPTDPCLLSAWRDAVGEPATVAGLLHDLDRRARPAWMPLTRQASAFRWDRADGGTAAWVPQGVTTSADADPSGHVQGRALVCVAWYRRTAEGPDQAARVTLADITDPAQVTYRHVLLVHVVRDPRTGRAVGAPVRAHAGGIVWYGDVLYVAATYTGLRVFDLTDLVRVDPAGHDGYDYVLPQRWAYEPAGDAASPMRFSFVSLDRTSGPHGLLAGEYGGDTGDSGAPPTQIVRFGLDADGHLARADERDGDDVARPLRSFALDVPTMQGVACVDGTYFVAASHGRSGRGDLWVGGPRRAFRQHRCALPPGPEDLSAWPTRGRLWSPTEYAGRRVVYALRTADWVRAER